MVPKRIKQLRPSLREKKRYMAFEVLSRQPVTEAEVRDAIWNCCLVFLGEQGMSRAGMMVLHDKWRDDPQKGILRVAHTEIANIRSALSLIKKIGGKEAIVTTIGMSGMLNKAVSRFVAGK